MSLSSGSTPSPSSSDERSHQQLQQNLATVDGSLFIAPDDSSLNNTRAPHFPSLASASASASANAQYVNERRLLQSQNIDHAVQIFEHQATSRISLGGENDRMRMSSQQPQQPTPSYADDDGRAISGSSDRQSLIQLAALEQYDKLQKDHIQQVVDVPPARSGTTDDRIEQQSEPLTLNKDYGNDVTDTRASVLATHTRSPRDLLTLGYDAQIREYNRLNQAHMQRKQQSRPNDQMGNVDMHGNVTISDLASHPTIPFRDTTHAIDTESRPNETNDDVREGSPYVDLDVLEAQLRERVHVSSQQTADNVPSNNNESSSLPGMASVPSSNEDVGISVHALEAQLREYERLNSAHIQQKQQSQPPSREIELIEGEEKVSYNDAAVGASGTSGLRNNSGVGDRFVKNYVDVATLNQTEY